ncbi:MAG: aminoacyl-tRNA hydrolase, partial [Chloroflexi bacterium]|nr:aminoacyl-tRNA hydrolase [Chloroflexota bacterium]
GFWCIDRLMEEHSIKLERRHQAALVGQGLIEGHRVALAKPRTYVNLSGQAASYLLARFKASPRELLVIYDDVALPLGKLRLRRNGSAGGHNGIKSIIEALGTQEFPRLRVGIGRPPEGADQIGHVLGTMPDEEQKVIDEAVERVVQVVASILNEGIEAAMGKFN